MSPETVEGAIGIIDVDMLTMCVAASSATDKINMQTHIQIKYLVGTWEMAMFDLSLRLGTYSVVAQLVVK